MGAFTRFTLVAAIGALGVGCGGGNDDGTPSIAGVAAASDLFTGGLLVTITGSGFTGADEVRFGSVSADAFGVVDDATIAARVPAGTSTGAVDLTVSSGGGSDTLANGFTYFAGYIYAAQGTSGQPGLNGASLWRVNPISGETAFVGPLMLAGENVTVTGMTFDDSGNLWASESTEKGTWGDLSGNSRLFRIDPDTGAVTSVGYLVDAGMVVSHAAMPDLTFSNGTLFGWTEDSDMPATIDTATGVVTVIGGGTGSAGSGMAADAAGVIWIAPDGPSGDLYNVDPLDGMVTSVVTLGGGFYSEISGMTWADGTLYAVEGAAQGDPATPARLVTIDTSTGEVAQVGLGLPPGTECIAAMVF